MELVRRHRRAIMAFFSVVMLVGMTYAFLRRVGVDPLASFRRDPSTETAP